MYRRKDKGEEIKGKGEEEKIKGEIPYKVWPSEHTNEASKIVSNPLFYAVIIVLIINGYIVHWARQKYQAESASTIDISISGFKVADRVNRVRYSPDAPFINRIVSRRLPVIIEESPVSEWKSIQRWNSAYLWRHLKNLDYCYRSDRRVFTYASHNRSMTQIPNRNTYSVLRQLPWTDFVNDMHNQDLYYYYSGPLLSWGKKLALEVTPHPVLQGGDPFPMQGRGDGSQKDQDRLLMSVWMGHPHVVTTTHYDREHNFYTQVVGTKRFILFKPETWSSLYLYPSPHPHARQSQIDSHPTALEPSDMDWQEIRTRNEAMFPRFTDPKTAPVGLEAVLHPGDLLYIPPYWFHHVEALEFSVSVSTVVVSSDAELFQRAKDVPLLLQEDWDASTRANAVSLYVEELINAVEFCGAPHACVQELLVTTRYRQIFQNTDRLERNPIQCRTDIAPITRGDASKMVKPVVSLFLDMVPGPREILFGDYLEGLAYWAVGGDDMPYFFANCF